MGGLGAEAAVFTAFAGLGIDNAAEGYLLAAVGQLLLQGQRRQPVQ